jgi:hypothetical protein
VRAPGGRLGLDVDVLVGGKILAPVSDSVCWYEKMMRAVGGHHGAGAADGCGLAWLMSYMTLSLCMQSSLGRNACDVC